VQGEGDLKHIQFTVGGGIKPESGSANTIAENEVILTEFNNGGGREALDLDRQTVFAQPYDMDRWTEAGLSDWVRSNGIDLLVDHGPQGRWALMTIAETSPKLAIVANEKWDRITGGEFERAIAESCSLTCK
jgi:hypothetical protein